jgi:glycosyltransferase involved in cell wall biosynthesis
LGVANHVIQFVEAARKFDKNEAAFMIVGDGMQRKMLEEKVREYGLDNVIFTGFVPKTQVVDICAAADVCCAVLKKVDTFKTVYPNKVFDYMASARPVVVAIDGVARKLVEEQARSGYFVEPENSDQLAETLMDLKNNPEKRRVFGQNGYEFVQEHFDRRKIADKYIRLIEDEIVPKGHLHAVKS